jgi:hypothetical protein
MRVDGDGVDLQQVADEGDEPGAQVLHAVGRCEEVLDAACGLAPLGVVGGFASSEQVRAWDDTRLQASQQIEVDTFAQLNAVVKGGQVAQLLEGGLLGGAWALRDVVADGIRPLARPALGIGQARDGSQRLARREDPRAGEEGAAGADPRGLGHGR